MNTMTDHIVQEESRRFGTSFLSEVTVLILTANEAPNIGRTLGKLQRIRRVIVVDSFSDDRTLEIIRKHGSVELRQRHFDSHADQWNFGIDQVTSEWVLALDADYQLTDSFVSELETLSPSAAVDAYYVRFKYCIGGKALRGTLYPPRAVLFRRSRCRYEQHGHTQVLKIDGEYRWLRSSIYHDDRKPLSDWLKAQDRYAVLEAKHLLTKPIHQLNVADRLRRLILPAPLLVFLYTLFIKRSILDGWPGWYYVFQRTLAEALLSLRLVEAKLSSRRLLE